MQHIYIDKITNLNFEDLKITNRIFLVTGRKSFETSGAQSVILDKLQGHSIVRFSDFETNPRLEDVRKGLKLLSESKADTIIAVGGGSVIDMAKLIKGLSDQPYEPEEYICGRKVLENSRDTNLITIPTTSGSGSESTHFAVVYINKVKYSLAHSSLLPNNVILDYSLTLSMSPYQAACSGFDALAQAVESFWSVNSSGKSSEYSTEAIKLIKDNLVPSVTTPTEKNRSAMQHASNLAGKAINLTKTTAPHAFCYYLTSHYGIPHGHAAALLLGKFIVYNSNISNEDVSSQDATAETVRQKIQNLCVLLGVKDTQEANQLINQMLSSCNLENDINKIMDLDNKFDDFFKSVNLERLKNNPRLVNNKEELKGLLKMRP